MIKLKAMMFKKLFGSRENPYFTIIKSVLPKGFDFRNYDIYYIKGFEATESNISSLELSCNENQLLNIIKSLEYNSQSDNINIYYFKNFHENQGQIYFITDPLELYEKEQILKKIDYNIDSQSLSNFEKINDRIE